MKHALLICAALSALLAGCSQGNEQKTASSADAVKADAPTLYKNYCLSCHGNNLQGLKGPNLQKVGERLDESEIITRIQKGGGGMPPFQVSMKDEEVKALASWLAGMK